MTEQTKTPKLRLFRFIFWIPVLGICGLFLLAGRVGYPIPTGDSGWILPPAINWARTGSFTSTFEPAIGDPTGQGRYFDAPMIEWVVKTLLVTPTAPNAIFIIAVINALAIFLWGVVLWRCYVAGEHRHPKWALAFHLAAAGALAGPLIYNLGRPESLATVWALVGLLILPVHRPATSPTFAKSILLGCIIGLMMFTQLIASAIAAWALAAWYFYHYPWRVALRHLVLAAVCCLAVFLISMKLMYPYPLRDWVHGIVLGSVVAGGSNLRSTLGYYSFLPDIPCLGILIASAAIVLVARLIQRGRLPSPPWLCFVSVAIVLWMLYHYAIAVGMEMYNLFPFIPLAALIAYYLAPPIASISVPARIALIFGWSAPFLMLLGPAWQLVLMNSYLRHGTSLASARQTFLEDTASFPRVAMAGEWALADRYERLHDSGFLTKKALTDPLTGAPFQYVVVRQFGYAPVVGDGIHHGKGVPGYHVLKSRVVSGRPTLFGVAVANSIPGYQYVIFEKD